MDSFYIVTIGVLTVLQISFQLSTGATVAPVAENTCPRLLTRTENGSLIVEYQASNENCEMVVTTETVQLRPSTEIMAFKKKHKTIRRPLVSFRNRSNLEGQLPCKPLIHSSLGPFAFVNTVPDQCQMLFRIQKTKNSNFEPKQPKQPRQPKEKGSGRRKGKKEGGKKAKKTKTPRHYFIPTFEYIDEFLY
ncbi:uncharacterized protein LOC110465540 [Mizuhopecten yessoensis]|uniref:Uncharacterized protein n=1 Tax=Mizuhopecten yessoensis TaxID=6573 RepID=A0A210PRC7_MIZYE|nr:uncharacterized protein LOC110465540 [Mizuhopecten yessoensis]OWF39049.1 hypothetical protein KP79_PYT21903 [Mizuhopecten yessoensis]